MTTKNVFKDLMSVDVSGHIEQKGRFSYLSWPFAVKTLAERYPDASWEVRRFPLASDHDVLVPYMETPAGYFVEVEVTVNGITRSQIHPVLNNANKPIPSPNAFDINTSIMRCLVKAIALHGLGLHIYAGEDLPGFIGEQAEQVSDDQAAEIARLIEEVGADGTKFCAHFKVSNIGELTTAQYAMAKKMLEAKRAA